tara:strand:- start:544 stop:1239 length:696 start_codon:yes stop_codon:yes gene_type:complete
VKRLKEPELMICRDQIKAYAETDFSVSDSELIHRLDKYVAMVGKVIDRNSFIVDLGCGPGNITELLFERWPYSTVIGIDGSAEMLHVAKERARKFDLIKGSKGIKYLNLDVGSFSNGKFILDAPADLLVSNSLLHHLHDPSRFWLALQNLGSKGSVIFHRDLRRPLTREKAIRLLEKHHSTAHSILKKDFLASLHASFTVDEVKAQLKSTGLHQLKVFEVDDRYLEIVGVL